MLALQPEIHHYLFLTQATKAYHQGLAWGRLTKQANDLKCNLPFAGMLQLQESGYLALAVSNSLVRGLFDALQEEGAVLPLINGKLDGHIAVASKEELQGVAKKKLDELRGREVTWRLGCVHCLDYAKKGVEKIWYMCVDSPELQEVRSELDLEEFPAPGEFQLVFAIKRESQEKQAGR